MKPTRAARKKTTNFARVAAAQKLPPGALERTIVLLCTGCTEETAAARIADDSGDTPATARRCVELAKAAIVRAAAFDRTQELGRAYYRLTDIYHRAIDGQENVALGAQKELNKLLDLYSSARDRQTDDAPSTESTDGRLETAVRGYIVPLGIAPADAPLVEHIRILAARYLDQAGDRAAV